MTAPGRGARVPTVFLGSGSFGVPALRALATHPSIDLVGVVTAPARPVGRRQVLTPTPIAAAVDPSVPILVPERLRAPEAIAEVLALQPDLAVLADYGQLVPTPILDLPRGALNLHPSLLPRHRGATPIPAAILAGDAVTGVTLMRMDEGLDTGPIVASTQRLLDGTEIAAELEAELADRAAELLVHHLNPYLAGERPLTRQPDEGATLTRPLRREDGRLDARRPAAELERQVRAYRPWPGTSLETGSERLVVTAAAVAPSRPGDEPGRLVREGALPALATSEGRLALLQVTPSGRRPMSGEDWLRGRPEAMSESVR